MISPHSPYLPPSSFLSHPAKVIPSFFRTPKNTSTVKGGNFTLTCRAYHATSYQWLLNSAPLENSDRITVGAVAANGDLTVTNATVADEGEYTCVAIGEDCNNSVTASVSVLGDLLNCSGEDMERSCDPLGSLLL